VERLAEVLEGFDGTLLVVSHDEYLLSRVATRVIEMRPGRLRDVPGTLADYRVAIEAGFGQPTSGSAAGPDVAQMVQVDDKKERIRRRQERTQLERAVEKVERQIAQLEGEMQANRSALLLPDNATNHALLHELVETLGHQERQHDELMKEWERVQGELES
jgi:ATP-binding cassette subfamily F protein 3